MTASVALWDGVRLERRSLFVCLLVAGPSNMLVYLRDGERRRHGD